MLAKNAGLGTVFLDFHVNHLLFESEGAKEPFALLKEREER